MNAFQTITERARTKESSGSEGTERVRSNVKPGEFWDTGVEADGCGLETMSVSIGSSFSFTWSSGGSEVSIGSSVPDEKRELQQLLGVKRRKMSQ